MVDDYTRNELKKVYTQMIQSFSTQLDEEKKKLEDVMSDEENIDNYATQTIFCEMVRLETFLMKAKNWLAELERKSDD